MAKPHKYERSRVTVDTRLAPERVAQITKDISTTSAVVGAGHVRFEGASAGRTEFSIRGPINEFMTFHVNIDSTPFGTRAETAIGRYKTSQQSVFLIPVTPRMMQGYYTYKKFMTNLAAAVQREDPPAQFQIQELR